MRHKITIKPSTLLLTAMLLLFVASIFASNIILKRQYNKTDKSDIYWNYSKILEQPFRHVVIEGGNYSEYKKSITGDIAFEPNKKPSVRVLKGWAGFEKNVVKASVRNDTLFIKLPDNKSEYYDRMDFVTLVRIFCPELISVDGKNSNLRFSDLTQKNLSINASRGSEIWVYRSTPNMDSVTIHAEDSSMVKFAMMYPLQGKETVKIKSVNADLQGTSTLDFGRAVINSLQLNMSDSAAIMLSGDALKKLKE